MGNVVDLMARKTERNEPVCSLLVPSTPDALARTAQFEEYLFGLPQEPLETLHTIHAGVYTRTITIPRGVAITGALIKVPTTLVINGDVLLTVGGEVTRLKGYNVIPASAGRKTIFAAHRDSQITMIHHTSALSVEEVEMEFTDEWDRLGSRQNPNTVVITGE